MAPSAAGATTTTKLAPRTAARSPVVPSSASGDQTPPTPSTSPTSTAAGGQRSVTSVARSANRTRGRPSTSAPIGGAMGTGYHRSAGQTVVGASPVAAPRASASVASSAG